MPRRENAGVMNFPHAITFAREGQVDEKARGKNNNFRQETAILRRRLK
jgi:hypothetical protein